MSADLAPGDLLAGRFRLERLLGEGGVARVWLARDTRERGRVWAVKQLLLDEVAPAERAEVQLAFRREAELLRRCAHPGIPECGPLLAERGYELLCMERVEGPNLEEVLAAAAAPLPEHLVAGWGVQLCELLAVLHDQAPTLVYRDLKPANVMLTMGERVSLVDFGIVCEAYDQLSQVVPCYGTPGYAAPEQYRGLQQPRSDIYALGATLYQLLTGLDPQAPGFAFAPLRRVREGCSPAMEELLARCLQPDPAARPHDVHEVATCLEALTRPPQPTWQDRLRRWWSGGL